MPHLSFQPSRRRHVVAVALSLPSYAVVSVALAKGEPTIGWGTYYGEDSSSSSFGGLGALPDGSVLVMGGPTGGTFAERISRFDAAGQLMWSFHYGYMDEWAFTLMLTIVPGQSDFYVTGMTEADEGIATVGTHQTERSCFGHGAWCAPDGFIARFDDASNQKWGTYFGGPFDDRVYAVAADGSGAVYVCGETNSLEGIATPGSYQPALLEESGGFIASFEPTGVLRWATYYGSSCNAITVDEAGDAVYITGIALDAGDFATPGAHQEHLGGGSDAYLAQFTSTGERAWATYYGGPGDDSGQAIEVDATGAVYVLGETGSNDAIATYGALQDRPGGQQDLFLARFTEGGERVWATYFGGTQDELASGLALGEEGDIYLSTNTTSDGLATQGAPRPHPAGDIDVVVARFDGGGAVRWSTYYGGPGSDAAGGLDVGPDGSVYFAGITESDSGIATPGAYQDIFPSWGAAFIVKLLQDR